MFEEEHDLANEIREVRDTLNHLFYEACYRRDLKVEIQPTQLLFQDVMGQVLVPHIEIQISVPV